MCFPLLILIVLNPEGYIFFSINPYKRSLAGDYAYLGRNYSFVTSENVWQTSVEKYVAVSSDWHVEVSSG